MNVLPYVSDEEFARARGGITAIEIKKRLNEHKIPHHNKAPKEQLIKIYKSKMMPKITGNQLVDNKISDKPIGGFSDIIKTVTKDTLKAVSGDMLEDALKAVHKGAPQKSDILAGIVKKLSAKPLKNDIPLVPMTQITLTKGFISESLIADMIISHLFIAQDNDITFNGRTYALDFLIKTPEKIKAVASIIGYNTENRKFDDLLQLLWWDNIFNAPDCVTPNEKLYISELSISELQETSRALGYTGDPDPASLIWSIIKRQMPPQPSGTISDDYQNYLDNYSFSSIHRAAVTLSDFYGIKSGIPSPYTPFRHLTISPLSPLLPLAIMYGTDGETIDDYAKRLLIVYPPSVKTIAEKEKYFFTNLRKYEKTADHDQETPIFSLGGKNDKEIQKTLRLYADQILLDRFEPLRLTWTSRSDLVKKLTALLHQPPSWNFRKNYPQNDDRINIVSGDRRDKTDPDDPIVSYGTYLEYRSYNVGELTVSFRKDDALGFQFFIPDWKPGDPHQFFSIDVVKQLATFLEEEKRPTVFGVLLQKIKVGINELTNIISRVQSCRKTINLLSKEDQVHLRHYLTWGFMYAMILRFWKGPGNAYPLMWVEGGDKNNTYCCDTETRERNVHYWFEIRNLMLTKFSDNLKRFILELPRIKYNFKTLETTIGQEKVNEVVEKIIGGNFCLADASDRLLQTIYYLTTRIYEFTELKYNQFLRLNMLEIYQKYEQQYDLKQLGLITDNLKDPNFDLEKEKKVIKALTDKISIKVDFAKIKTKKGLLTCVEKILGLYPEAQVANYEQLKSTMDICIFSVPALTETRHIDPNWRV